MLFRSDKQLGGFVVRLGRIENEGFEATAFKIIFSRQATDGSHQVDVPILQIGFQRVQERGIIAEPKQTFAVRSL